MVLIVYAHESQCARKPVAWLRGPPFPSGGSNKLESAFLSGRGWGMKWNKPGVERRGKVNWLVKGAYV